MAEPAKQSSTGATGGTPVAANPASSTTPTATQRASAIFRAIQASSVLLGGLAVVLASYYYFYSRRQQDYLALRNQRALVTMAAQVHGALETADQVLSNLTADSASAESNSFLAHLSVFDTRGRRIAGRGGCTDAPQADSGRAMIARWESNRTATTSCLHRTTPAAKPKRKSLSGAHSATLDARTLLQDVVDEPVARRIVDAAFVADTLGLVLAQSGPPELMVHRLNRLLGAMLVEAKSRDAKPVDRSWETVRGSATRIPVLIGQHTYDLYLQPCCSTGAAFKPQGLIVAALVRRGTFVRRSLQISYTVVAGLLAVLLLVSTAGPFLKLQLIGPFQKVTVVDVVALAFCTILVLSVTTVVALDMWAYSKFKRDLESQTQLLGDSIADHFAREVGALHGDLVRLAKWSAKSPTPVAPADRAHDVLTDRTLPHLRYPRYESWTVVAATGQQERKWSFDRFTQPTVSVATREYFRAASAGRAWSVPRIDTAGVHSRTGGDTTVVIESIQSWTTGRRQAILAIPAPEGGQRVASLTVELASVIDPVVAPHFVFTVIDSLGRVLFHSEKSRNLYEGFFAESDQARAIRSAVFARTATIASVKYGGEDHVAYVRPLPGTPWSLVTLLDKLPARVTNLETVGTTMMLVVVFAISALLLGLLHVSMRRERRLSWIWPARNRSDDYSRLATAYAFLILAFLISQAFLSGSDLALASALLPLDAAVLTWGLLRIARGSVDTALTFRHRLPAWAWSIGMLVLLAYKTLSSEHPYAAPAMLACAAFATALALSKRLSYLNAPRFEQWPVSRRYLLAATLLLLLVSALPAAGFFQVAYRLHMQSFVRHGQYRLASALEERDRARAATYNAERGAFRDTLFSASACSRQRVVCGLDLYHAAFFNTGLLPGRDTIPTAKADADWPLLGFVEPYQTEASLERRPMLLLAAEDRRWRASVMKDTTWLEYTARNGQHYRLRSRIPSLAPRSLEAYLGASVIVVVLTTLAWGLASFVCRRLFLLDLLDAQPLGDLDARDRVRRNLLVFVGTRLEERAWLETTALDPVTEKRAVLLDLSLPPEDWGQIVNHGSDQRPVIVKWPSAVGASAAAVLPRLEAVERLLRSMRVAVVIVVRMGGAATTMHDRRSHFAPAGEAEWTDRVNRLWSHFVLIDAVRSSGLPEAPMPSLLLASPQKSHEITIAMEQYGDPTLPGLWTGIEDDVRIAGPLGGNISTTAELLDRLGERAALYYESLWTSCNRDEKAVLVRLAEDRFPNSKDRAVYRRLLTRGLIRRTPRLALLNETFRRFVVSRGAVLEALVEKDRERSVWDGVKWPIASVIVLGLVFFVATQQEFFSAASGVVVGLTTTIPAFIRLISWVGDRRVPS